MEERTEVITDDHRKLVFSFIRMMRTAQVLDPERSEAVALMLGEEFAVDPASIGASYDTEVDVLEAFNTALREKEKGESVDQDEKFLAFVSLLEKKGYFKGVEKDTPEYEQRMLKAKEKFIQRNNPYDGLTAEQIKNKGNELMSQAKYREAIAYYTKAIELEAENAVFFANRAAAHTHLKDYNNAVIDCERAIVLKPSYSKSYSRLGTALFYQENYQRAVDAFTRACELDPDNAAYKEDLKRAEEKAKAGSVAQSNANAMNPFAGMAGMSGMPGMPDMSQFTEMMNNPAFASMAQRMMQNPQFTGLVSNMARQLAEGGGMNPENFAAALPGQADANGNIASPFGNINHAALQKLKEDSARENPRLAAIMDEVAANGPAAFQKYMGDPDVLDLMEKFNALLSGRQQ